MELLLLLLGSLRVAGNAREFYAREKNYRIGVKKNKNNEAEGERHVKSYTRIL